jgi:hypothetical protein
MISSAVRSFAGRSASVVPSGVTRSPPAHEVRADSETCPRTRAIRMSAPGLHASLFQRLGKRHRHGGGTHIAVALDREHDLIHRHAAPGHDSFDDPHIGLVRDDEVNVVRRDPHIWRERLG